MRDILCRSSKLRQGWPAVGLLSLAACIDFGGTEAALTGAAQRVCTTGEEGERYFELNYRASKGYLQRNRAPKFLEVLGDYVGSATGAVPRPGMPGAEGEQIVVGKIGDAVRVDFRLLRFEAEPSQVDLRQIGSDIEHWYADIFVEQTPGQPADRVYEAFTRYLVGPCNRAAAGCTDPPPPDGARRHRVYSTHWKYFRTLLAHVRTAADLSGEVSIFVADPPAAPQVEAEERATIAEDVPSEATAFDGPDYFGLRFGALAEARFTPRGKVPAHAIDTWDIVSRWKVQLRLAPGLPTTLHARFADLLKLDKTTPDGIRCGIEPEPEPIAMPDPDEEPAVDSPAITDTPGDTGDGTRQEAVDDNRPVSPARFSTAESVGGIVGTFEVEVWIEPVEATPRETWLEDAEGLDLSVMGQIVNSGSRVLIKDTEEGYSGAVTGGRFTARNVKLPLEAPGQLKVIAVFRDSAAESNRALTVFCSFEVEPILGEANDYLVAARFPSLVTGPYTTASHGLSCDVLLRRNVTVSGTIRLTGAR